MSSMVAELLKKQDRQIVANAKIATLKHELKKQQAELMVNLLIRQIVLYNDRIDIYFHTP